MTLAYAKMLIPTLGLLLLLGCNKPAGETTNDKPVTQTGSKAATNVPIEIEVEDPTQSNSLTAAAAIAPAIAKAGETVTIAVRAKTASGWHVYAFDHTGVGSPTKLQLELPADVVADGEWIAPEAHPYVSIEPTLVYEGDLMFQHTLTIAEGAAPGPREVRCKISYQTCNDAMCNPPTSMEVSATVEVE